MAGDLKYHQPCWNKIIVNRQVEVCFSSPRFTSTMFTSPTTTRTKLDQSMSPFLHIETYVNLEDEALENPCMNADIAREIVVVDFIRGVKEALTIEHQILNIGNIVEVYNARLQEFGVSDSHNAYAIRKYIKRILLKAIPDITFQTSTSNQPQRITVNNLQRHILNLAEKKVHKDAADKEVGILNKAATILRRKAKDFISKNPVNFKGYVSIDETFCPELITFTVGTCW